MSSNQHNPVHARFDATLRDSRRALCGEDLVQKIAGPMYGKVTCEACLEPKELFIEFGEPFEVLDPDYGPQMSSEMQCTKCKATTEDHPDLIEEDVFPSFGGTTEGYARCTVCGASESFADLSAVL